MVNCNPNRAIYKMLRYIFEVLSYMMSCIAIEDMNEEGFLIFFVDVFLFGCFCFFLSPYLTVNENGHNVSLASKLKYTPLDVELFINDRKRKMWKYIAKTVTIVTVLQTLGGILSHHGNWIYMAILPLSVLFIMSVYGMYSIHYFKRKLV